MKKNFSTVLIGLTWAALGLIVNKLLSFISQYLLGSYLSVETYGVFGLVVSSMVFVTVFQNTGISKVLISRSNCFDSIVKEYSAFNFFSGCFGLLVLVILGVYQSNRSNIESLEYVYLLTALSIPILSLATIYKAKLSINLKFKEINLILMIHSLVYYSFAIFLASSGAEIFTIAVSTLVAAIIQLFILYIYVDKIDIGYYIGFSNYLNHLKKLKWVLFTSFLSALAMRSDFLILSHLLSVEDLGYYYFGFMLVMSVTALISSGINQTLLPVFSNYTNDDKYFREQFIFISKMICLASTFLCLAVMLLAPFLVNYIWSGKWDNSIIVIVITALFIPVRMSTTLAYTTLEAKSKWNYRGVLTMLEIVTLISFVWVGALTGGLVGACIGTAIQRILSGLIAFPIVCKIIGLEARDSITFFIRTFSPFFSTLFFVSYLIKAEDISLGVDSNIDFSILLISLSLLVFLTFIFNFKLSCELLSKLFSRLRGSGEQ